MKHKVRWSLVSKEIMDMHYSSLPALPDGGISKSIQQREKWM